MPQRPVRQRGIAPAAKASRKHEPTPIPLNPDAPAKYAGTYRIQSWRSFEKRKLFHFFYLRPGGTFLLAAEWPRHETSRAVGEWQVSGDRLSLTGSIAVSTNKGRWRVPFRRSYLISLGERGIHLKPLPEKNRYGLLGWPNGYYFFRTRISPNLPSGGIPVTQEKMRTLIDKLR